MYRFSKLKTCLFSTVPQPVIRYKVITLLIIALAIGIYISIFGIYRISQGRVIVGSSELSLGIFFLIGFFFLRKDQRFYLPIARIFFVLVYILMIILTLYIPEERTHILWVPAVMVLIFFLLDAKGGLLFLGGYLLFILYLIVAGYDYTVTEYITWSVSLVSMALVLLFYEKVKADESILLQEQAQKLKAEVRKKEEDIDHYETALQQSRAAIEQLQNAMEKHASEDAVMRQQCRIESMQQMLDEIAHRWRQPLMHINALIMNLSHTLNEQKNLHEVEIQVDQIVELTAQMSDTIEEFRVLFDDGKQSETKDARSSDA